jgi:hypothetical protein
MAIEQELDIPRAKQMVIAMWREGKGNTLVKVMPKGMRPDPARMIGYCTTIKYVIGRTPALMERTLGFRADSKLAEGAAIFRVWPLPAPSQFEFRGYTQTPQGISTAVQAPHPDYPPGLGVPQWELVGYPQSGLHWLATVERDQRFTCQVDRLPEYLPAFLDNRAP